MFARISLAPLTLLAITAAVHAAPTTAPSPEKSTLGVLNPKHLVKALGWDQKQQADREAFNSKVTAELKDFQEELRKAIDSERAKIVQAAHLSDAQSAQLSQAELEKLPLTQQQRAEYTLVVTRVNEFNRRAVELAQSAVQKRQTAVEEMLTEAARPAVQVVAKQKGLKAVALSTSLFYTDPSIDITDAVLDVLVQNPPHLAFPDMQSLNLPHFSLPEILSKPGQPASKPSP